MNIPHSEEEKEEDFWNIFIWDGNPEPKSGHIR